MAARLTRLTDADADRVAAFLAGVASRRNRKKLKKHASQVS
jgi:hypothetical protein